MMTTVTANLTAASTGIIISDGIHTTIITTITRMDTNVIFRYQHP